ncbi:translation initiation factor IF-2-like isoform X2 [Prionailurus viverrinus]|uniref:translation initiation factor IF-2-like isoform X2 n=1 Tax=Prionailurus viverrinus TaxID=61388 RepID=UPI001FF25096|nr:translation initiation factor IF-2-like isoform X2 [Prionailurus viverrinus]XP_047697339.1 translation initiation factor IF-2-like isoform X2 [Prionailurus viverrinus]XP_047697340.1 translation initiation factor IF-2-like isoform X2 [Prionailurus viverrinus]XP_047697341.1 translation initiation factor IF-2-like isoform X2 [Prionailurus viverrinus]
MGEVGGEGQTATTGCLRLPEDRSREGGQRSEEERGNLPPDCAGCARSLGAGGEKVGQNFPGPREPGRQEMRAAGRGGRKGPCDGRGRSRRRRPWLPPPPGRAAAQGAGGGGSAGRAAGGGEECAREARAAGRRGGGRPRGGAPKLGARAPGLEASRPRGRHSAGIRGMPGGRSSVCRPGSSRALLERWLGELFKGWFLSFSRD